MSDKIENRLKEFVEKGYHIFGYDDYKKIPGGESMSLFAYTEEFEDCWTHERGERLCGSNGQEEVKAIMSEYGCDIRDAVLVKAMNDVEAERGKYADIHYCIHKAPLTEKFGIPRENGIYVYLRLREREAPSAGCDGYGRRFPRY